jgi:hypothetical protein
MKGPGVGGSALYLAPDFIRMVRVLPSNETEVEGLVTQVDYGGTTVCVTETPERVNELLRAAMDGGAKSQKLGVVK